jgi:peptide/nickel transport system substrate-binding protein
LFSKAKKIFYSFSQEERLIFWTAFAAAAIAAMFLAISTFNSITKKIPARGGSFVEGMLGQPTYINPVLATSETDRDLINLIFANAYDLAEKLETEDNGKSWRMRLKEKAKWHDGKLITSDDIIFTVEKIQDSESNSPLSLGWRGISAERISEREVRFNLAAPYIFFADNLKRLYPVPKHLFADIPISNWRLSLYNLEPIGSGPFQYISNSRRRDGYITEYRLKAFDDFFKGRPYIDSFIIRFYSDEENLIQAFNLAQLDGIGGGISPDSLSRLRRRYQLFSLPTPRYYAVFWNSSVSPILKDKNVRLALREAINKEELVKIIFNGNAMISDGPLSPFFSIPSHLPTTAKYSEEAANSVLDNSGWNRDKDGFRIKTIGKDKIALEFNLIVPQVPFLKETAEYLKKAWEGIGVKANIILINPQDITAEVIRTRNYEALLYGNILSGNPDLFSFWHSSQKFSPGLNLALYDNKTADKLIERIRQTSDEKKRLEDLEALQSLIIQDEAALFLYSPNYLYITSQTLQGFEPGIIVISGDRFSNVEKWYVKTSRTFVSNKD